MLDRGGRRKSQRLRRDHGRGPYRARWRRPPRRRGRLRRPRDLLIERAGDGLVHRAHTVFVVPVLPQCGVVEAGRLTSAGGKRSARQAAEQGVGTTDRRAGVDRDLLKWQRAVEGWNVQDVLRAVEKRKGGCGTPLIGHLDG